MIGEIISIKQSVFIKGMNFLDGILMVNEVIDMAKREKRSCMVLKVDYEKAYYSVSWNFFRYLLNIMGFGTKWLGWMEVCVFSSSLAVLVNGSNIKDFIVERGLRQGDPLSPFLFVIVMESLNRLMEKEVELGDFKGFGFGDGDSVDMLQFANDTVITGDGSNDNLWSMKVVLRGLELMS